MNRALYKLATPRCCHGEYALKLLIKRGFLEIMLYIICGGKYFWRNYNRNV